MALAMGSAQGSATSRRTAQADEGGLRLPTDEELLELIRSTAPICLRQLCSLVWPELSWRSVSEERFIADGYDRKPLSRWMRDRMRALLAGSRVRMAPFRANEPGEAGFSYVPA